MDSAIFCALDETSCENQTIAPTITCDHQTTGPCKPRADGDLAIVPYFLISIFQTAIAWHLFLLAWHLFLLAFYITFNKSFFFDKNRKNQVCRRSSLRWRNDLRLTGGAEPKPKNRGFGLARVWSWLVGLQQNQWRAFI